ncbi:hypothetical protein TcWFU_002515 [Taenia crassiceps]|uniref:Uncharacterized protein n=1 Tax=Taenia crassiceps TaxID=6207 RepID=A0ABR4QAQ1_9CEST
MAEVGGVDSDESTLPMEDGWSPPAWDGPAPVLNLLDVTRPTIPVARLFQVAQVPFTVDLLNHNDDGAYCIPLPIAAPMLILREKLAQELQLDYRRSFLHRLEFPTILRTDAPEIVDDLLGFLFNATSLEQCQNHFAAVSTRVVFETVVELIQRVQFLSLPISYETARIMLDVDFIRHKYGPPDEFIQPSGHEAAYVIQVIQDIIAAEALKRRISNILHYLWFRDLQNFNNEQVKLVFQFLVINFMHMLRMYCIAGGATTAGMEEGPFMVIDYVQMHAQSMEESLRVLGNKLGKCLILPPPAFLHEAGREVGLGSFSKVITSGKFFLNLLLLNQPGVWSPLAELRSFINHDQPDCNFQDENCICATLRTRFPQAVRGLTTSAT